MITFGGIPVSVFPRDPARLEEFLASIPIDELAGLGMPVYAATSYPWFDISAWEKRDPKLGHLYWPRGAARWAVGNFLASDAQLAKIRLLANAGGTLNYLPLVASDGKRTITTSLRMIAARPIGRRDGGNGLNLLQLVDDRWRWHHVAASIEIDPGVTTWEDLFADIGTALGVSIAVGSIDSAFLAPSPALSANYDSLPLLLDAAAYSVGMRVVRGLDGTVTVQSATSAAASIALQIEQTKRPRAAGEQFALDATIRPNDIAAHVPAQVVVRFPQAESGTLIAASQASTVTLASLALSGYTDAVGFAGSKLLHSTCIAHTMAAVLDNGPELTALATALAREYYRWALGGFDIVFAGVADWTPEGSEDYAEWIFTPQRFSTRIQSGDAEDFAIKVYHFGSYLSSDTGGTWIEGDYRHGDFSAGSGSTTINASTSYPIAGNGTVGTPISLNTSTSHFTIATNTLTLASGVTNSIAAALTAVSASYPIAGTGTSGNPLTLNTNTSHFTIATNTLTLATAVTSSIAAALAAVATTYPIAGNGTGGSPVSINYDPAYLAVTTNTLTLSTAAATSLGMASSSSSTYILATVMDHLGTIPALATRTGNTFTANSNGVMVAIDGVTLAVDSVVLINPLAAQIYNGGWKVTSVGSAGTPFTLDRAASMTTSAQTVPALTFTIGQGTYANTAFELTTAGATLNTTALTFTRVSQPITTADTRILRQGGVASTTDSTMRSTLPATVDDWVAMDGGLLVSSTTAALTSSASTVSLASTASRIVIGLEPSGSGKGLTYLDASTPENNRFVLLVNRSTTDSVLLNSTASVNGLLTPSDATETLSPRSMAIGLFDTTLTPDRWRVWPVGGSSSGATTLDGLTDVSISGGLANADALVYNSTLSLWTNLPSPGLSPIALNDLTDVVITTPASSQVVIHNGSNWVNAQLSMTDLGDFAGAATTDHLLAYDGADWTSRSVPTALTYGALNDLGNVNTAGVANGDVLTFNSGAGEWQVGPKAAIVPALGEFVGLACVEAPDVRFEDVYTLTFDGDHECATGMDLLFHSVCEPGSIVPVGVVPSQPVAVGVRVVGTMIVANADVAFTGTATVKLSGIRLGMRQRFPRHTREEMDANNRFWSGWKAPR